MTLADKRKVIEVLLCCSYEWSPDVTDGSADAVGHRGKATKEAASDEWYAAFADLSAVTVGAVRHYVASIEAAYRLIESSPTLRREWFGAR